MIRRLYGAARTAFLKRVGERRLPVGNVALDRRLLRRALGEHAGGSVLVVGPGLAARQAFPDAQVDVAGTSPHSAEISVCSAVDKPTALPPARWSTVIVMDLGADPAGRLGAARRACRDGGTLLVVDRIGWDEHSPEVAMLAGMAAVTRAVGAATRRAWLAKAAP